MPLRIIGEHPLARDVHGVLKSRIATVFPRRRTVVTLPGIHAWQRMAFIDFLNSQHRAAGQRSLTLEEEVLECEQSVDLIIDQENVLIRPDPENMALAFEADELLQELVAKQQIRFLHVRHEKVLQAIKARGECWRISPLPKTTAEMCRMIRESKISIRGHAIYYYNAVTGTRYLTLQEFDGLAKFEPAVLRQHLVEIAQWSGQTNRLANPEIDFFLTDATFGHKDFAAYDWPGLTPESLKEAHAELKARFEKAVPPELRADNPDEPVWRNRMFSALIGEKDEMLGEEILRGLSPEFFLQIEWLPGARMEDGELIFDPIFEEAEKAAADRRLALLCDPKAKGFIFDLIREYGDVEYVNLGRVATSLSKRPKAGGRRDVFIAELKPRGTDQRVVRIIRMQKWGIREHLEENKDLLRAIIETEEYTEYILNRRLGCRQLGMNLPSRVSMGRISEKYAGPRREFAGQVFWATYFERDYIAGVATDKVALSRFADPEYALRFARLLGRAAAPNIIVGRLSVDRKVVFDDGDETIVEDGHGLPGAIIVTDHTGAFGDYTSALDTYVNQYAAPILRRLPYVSRPGNFSDTYLGAFLERFLAIQGDYHKRRRAFDNLFKHCVRDDRGSFAYRWEKVLERLDHTDPRALIQKVRAAISPSS